MYKVFFKESSFLLTDKHSLLKNSTFTHIYKTREALENFVRSMLREDSFKAILYATDTEKLWMDFKEIFTYVEAAGGCVIDDQKLLLIRRFGIYDLPKGHLEKKETPESGGIREVEEECGVKGLNITGVLQPTYHIYAQNGDLFLKKTFWYTMSCSPGQHLTPQTEEGIEEVFWLKIDDLSSIFNNTYDSLKEIFKEVIYRLRS